MVKKVDTRVVVHSEDKTRKGLTSAEGRLKRFDAKATAIMKKAGKAATAFGAAVAAASAPVVGLAVSSQRLARELQMAHRMTKFTFDDFQTMRALASATGVEFDELRDVMSDLFLAASEATFDDEMMANAFKELGIQITDANGVLLDNATLMRNAIDSFDEYGRETSKAAHFAKIFGEQSHRILAATEGGAAGVEKFSNAIVKLDESTVNALASVGNTFDVAVSGLGKKAIDSFSNYTDQALEAMALFTGSAHFFLDAVFDNRRLIGFFSFMFNNINKIRQSNIFNLGVQDRINELIEVQERRRKALLHHQEMLDKAIAEGNQAEIANRERQKAWNAESLLSLQKEMETLTAKNELLQLANELIEQETVTLDMSIEKQRQALALIRERALAASGAGDGGLTPGDGADDVEDAEKRKRDAISDTVKAGEKAVGAIADLSKEEFRNARDTQIALATVNTSAAAISGYRADTQAGVPTWIAAVNMLGTIAAGVAQVNAIRSTSIGGSSPAAPTGTAASQPSITSYVNVYGSLGSAPELIADEVRSELQKDFNR